MAMGIPVGAYMSQETQAFIKWQGVPQLPGGRSQPADDISPVSASLRMLANRITHCAYIVTHPAIAEHVLCQPFVVVGVRVQFAVGLWQQTTA